MKLTRWMIAVTVAAATVLAWGSLTARAGEAEIKAALDLAPAEAPIVLIVPNIQTLGKKLSSLMQTMGVQEPEALDPMQTIRNKTGMVNGIKEDGSVVVVFTDTSFIKGPKPAAPPVPAAGAEAPAGADVPAAAHAPAPGAETDGKPVVGIIPITDFEAFSGNFKDVQLGEIRQGTDPDGTIIYFKKQGSFALVAERKELLEKFVSANQGATWLANAGKLGVRHLGKADVAVLVNVSALAPKLQPLVAEGVKKFAEQVEMAGHGNPGMMGGKWMAPMYGAMAEAVLRDTNLAVLAYDLSDKGVGVTAAAQFKPDSKLAKIFGTGVSAGPLLAKTPDKPYLGALALDVQGIDLATLVAEVKAKMPADLPKDEAEMINVMLDAVTKFSSMNAGYYLATGPDGVTEFSAVSVVKTSDPAGYRKALQTQFAQLAKMAEQVNKAQPAGGDQPADGGPGAGQPQAQVPAGMKVEYKANAEKIAGLDADVYSYAVSLPPEVMMTPLAGIFQSLTNISGYVVTQGDQVIVTANGGTAAVEMALKNLEIGKGLSTNAGINQARAAGLENNASMEGYLNLDSLVSMFSPMGAMFGLPEIKLPKDTPPIAFGLTVQEGGLAGRVFVPQELFVFIGDTKKKMEEAQQGMQGGHPNAPRGPRRRGPVPAPEMQ